MRLRSFGRSRSSNIQCDSIWIPALRWGQSYSIRGLRRGEQWPGSELVCLDRNFPKLICQSGMWHTQFNSITSVTTGWQPWKLDGGQYYADAWVFCPPGNIAISSIVECNSNGSNGYLFSSGSNGGGGGGACASPGNDGLGALAIVQCAAR